jgi:hypothetical protein
MSRETSRTDSTIEDVGRWLPAEAVAAPLVLCRRSSSTAPQNPQRRRTRRRVGPVHLPRIALDTLPRRARGGRLPRGPFDLAIRLHARASVIG